MKKLNKFLSGILSIAMVASCVCTSALAEANAADVSDSAVTVISTMTYANAGWEINGDAVNGVGVWGKPVQDGGYELSIPINVAAEGVYYFSFEAVCGSGGEAWLSPMEFKIDDGTYEKLVNSTNVNAGDYTTGKNYGGSEYRNLDYISGVTLTAGQHTLYFMADTLRSYNDGIFAALSDITITPKAVIDSGAVVGSDDPTVISTIKYANADWEINDEQSGVGVWGKPEKVGGYVLSIPINVTSGGTYKLSFEAVCGSGGEAWLSPLEFKIDGGAYEKLTNDVNVIKGDETGKNYGGSNYVNLSYSSGVSLAAGNHTLYFMADTLRSYNDGIFAALSDIIISPFKTVVSDTGKTVIPAGTCTSGCDVFADESGNRLVGSNGNASLMEIPFEVEKTGYYKLSFDGLFNTTRDPYWFSNMRFALDDGRENADVMIDGTDYLINGKNITTTIPDANRKVWGAPIENIVYNSSLYLTAGQHTLWFVIDEERNGGGYYGALGDITFEPQSGITLNSVIDAKVSTGYTASGANGTIHANTAASASFTFEVLTDGCYEIDAELMADITGDIGSLSPLVFSLDSNPAVKLTADNTREYKSLGFGVPYWGDYYLYRIGEPVELTAGTHTVSFMAEEAISSEDTQVITGIRNVIVDPMNEAAVESVEISLPETDIDFNPEENVLGYVNVTSNGQSVVFDDFKYYTFESSNPEAVSVNGDGELVANGRGKATITFRAGVYGTAAETTASAEIFVYEDGICVYDVVSTDTATTAKVSKRATVSGEVVYAAARANGIVKAAVVPKANADGVYEINIPSEAGDTVECFIWNGTSAMTPVCGSILLK